MRYTNLNILQSHSEAKNYEKELIRPDRKRKITPRFSWIDHRLVQHQYFKKTSS